LQYVNPEGKYIADNGAKSHEVEEHTI
jgi:hypothetical protein